MCDFIYKYQALNIDNLAGISCSKLWFSRFSNLNDPFEATYQLTPKLIFDNAHSFIGMDSTIGGVIRNSAVCCFTKVCPEDNDFFMTNSLMWSHYAEQFKGICIEFDKHKLLSSIKNSFCGSTIFGDVIYTKGMHCYENREQAYDSDVMLKKNTAWEYEKEFRIILNDHGAVNDFGVPCQAGGLQIYSSDSITRIFIGGRMSPDKVMLLKTITEMNNIELINLRIGNSRYEFNSNFDQENDWN